MGQHKRTYYGIFRIDPPLLLHVTGRISTSKMKAEYYESQAIPTQLIRVQARDTNEAISLIEAKIPSTKEKSNAAD